MKNRHELVEYEFRKAGVPIVSNGNARTGCPYVNLNFVKLKGLNSFVFDVKSAAKR